MSLNRLQGWDSTSDQSDQQLDRDWGEMLSENSSLQVLQLNWCALRNIGQMCMGLAVNSTLQVLNLAANSLDEKQGEALGEALRTNIGLRCLRLRAMFGTFLGPRGCRAILSALAVNRSLEVLDLSGQRAQDEGGHAAAQMLRENTTLHTLLLGGNRILRPALLDILQALKHNTSLRVCVLGFQTDDNKFPLPGKAVAELLDNNSSLLALAIHESMEASECVEVAKALVRNRSLTSLNISDNRMNLRQCVEFVKVLAGCTEKPVKGSCPTCGHKAREHPVPGALSLLHLEMERFLPNIQRHEEAAADYVRVTTNKVLQRNANRYVGEIAAAVRGVLSRPLANIVFEYLTEVPDLRRGPDVQSYPSDFLTSGF
jgi:Ran GTPase-activating protein (RanGAP) involved in mRNA processing and transport